MNLIFAEMYWGMTAVGRVQSEWTPSVSRVQSEWTPSGFIHFTRDPLRSYLNELRKRNKIHFLNKFRKKIKFIIFTLFFSRTVERTKLQAALRAGGLYLDSLRAATSSQQ